MRHWRGTVANTVEGYLAELRAALAGADPALVQDATYDAEEYLRTAIAEAGPDAGPSAVTDAIDAYGTPEEIATAYRDSELTVAAALRKPKVAVTQSEWGRSPVVRFFGIVMDPAAWGALFYMLLALATGILYFTLVVTGFSLTLGFAVLIIGIPFALLFIGMIRAISLAEGRMVEGLLGERMPRRPRIVGGQGNLWDRIKGWLGDYRTWTTMLYMVLQLPLGIIYFTTVVTALSVSAAVFIAPIAQTIWGQPVFRSFEYGYYIEPWAMPLIMALGVLGFFVTLWLAKGVGKVHGMWAKTMLVGRLDAGTGAEQAPAPAPYVGGAL
jgi:uncharacterized membrane protein